MKGHNLKSCILTCECGFTTTDIKAWLDHATPGLANIVTKMTIRMAKKVAED